MTDVVDPVVFLSDQQGLLSRFTQGLAGRYFQLRSTSVLTGNFRPSGATTDGAAIYLPESIGQFDTPRDNLAVYRVSIVHQLGYYEFGTFDFSTNTAEERIPAPAAAHKPAPTLRRFDNRPVDLERFFDRFTEPRFARRLFLILEDFRIDTRLPTRFPGIVPDLQRAMRHALAERATAKTQRTVIGGLLEQMIDYSLGADAETLTAADSTGLLATLIKQMATVARRHADVYDTAAATVRCHDLLIAWRQRDAGILPPTVDSASDRNGLPDGRNDTEPDKGGDLPLISEQDLEISGAGFRGDLLPELVQRQIRLADLTAEVESIEKLGRELPPEVLAEHLDHLHDDFDSSEIANTDGRDAPQRMTGDPAQAAAMRPGGAEALAQLIRAELDATRVRVRREESVLRRALGQTRPSTRSYSYDEWDYLQSAYRKGWCRLYEHRLTGENYHYYRNVRWRYRLLAAKIEHELRRVRAESLVRVKQVADGDELDLDSLLQALVDRRAGQITDERVYSRRERARREVTAAFLLDMSASTDDPVPVDTDPTIQLDSDPAEPTAAVGNTLTHDCAAPGDERRVIDVAKDALVLISDALTMLGDAFAVYGFSGYGRDDVEFYVAKEFDEALGSRSKAAIAAMEPKRSTRMGPAIRHAVRRLRQQDTPLKVLIILSDGFPQDCDYGPDRNDHGYGIRDTAKAIREAEDRQVTVFCITVDRSGHDYLRQMCAEDRYLVIEEIESLPEQLNKIYQRLTQ